MNTELVKPENKNLAVNQSIQLPAGIEAGDLDPSKLMLQQKMSQLVDQGKAKAGDICDSVSGEVLGGEGKPVEFIPLCVKKIWVTYDIDGKDRKFRSVTPFGPSNANWKYDEVEDGKPVKHDLVMVWSVLPLGSDTGMPSLINFKSMSFRAGKKLANLVAKVAFSGKRHTDKAFLLTSVKQSNDKGSFHVFDVSQGRDATPEERAQAVFWESVVLNKPVKLDHEDEPVPF